MTLSSSSHWSVAYRTNKSTVDAFANHEIEVVERWMGSENERRCRVDVGKFDFPRKHTDENLKDENFERTKRGYPYGSTVAEVEVEVVFEVEI